MYICCNGCKKSMKCELMPRMHEAAWRAAANGRELRDCPFFESAWFRGIEGVSPVTPFVGGRR
jgi:hypothetical protein